MSRRRRRRRRVATLAALATLATLALWAPTASAEIEFCPPGSGAGQCAGPFHTGPGVAVNAETSRIYVTDQENRRVNVFASDGSFLFAFGWGVDTGAAEAETCTIESTCQAGIAGAGAGQFSKPTRIAIDNTGGPDQGAVYVGTDNFRVQKFDPEGNFELMFGKEVNSGTSGDPDVCTNVGAPTDVCGTGVRGKAECQLGNGLQGSAPDAFAVGPGGAVYIADTAMIGSKESEGFIDRIERFAPGGECEGETILSEGGNVRLDAVAADSTGDVYVVVNAELRKYDLTGPTRLCEAEFDIGLGGTLALAVDGADNLFAMQAVPRDEAVGTARVVTEYDSSCAPVRRLGYGKFSTGVDGLARLASPSGDVLATQRNDGVPNLVLYLDFPEPGPIVLPESLELAGLGNTKVTLVAEVNPEGKATDYRFDYVDEQSFEAEGGFASPNTRSVEGELAAEDFDLHTVKATIGCPDPVSEAGLPESPCLTPETAYRFRIVASNEDGGGEGEAEGPAFETLPALEIKSTFATEVGTDAAKIAATVNPVGIPATGHFEYVDQESYEESGFSAATRVPAEGEFDFGASEEPTTRSAPIFPLSPATAYRYRVIATDPLIEPVVGEPHVFTTFAPAAIGECPANEAFRPGPAAYLPDCRAYEMVSPLEKENGDAIPLLTPNGLPATLDQSSTDGAKLAYGTYRAFGDAVSAPYTSQYVAERGGEGWSSHAISPPRDRLNLERLNMLDTEFRIFSPDLCRAWLRTVAEPPLTGDAIAGYPNLYRRLDQAQGCGGESYEVLASTPPPNANPQAYSAQQEVQGTSADGSVAIFAAPDNLVEGMPPQPTGCEEEEEQTCLRRLYLHEEGGALGYVCVLPGGEAFAEECSAGTANGSTAGGRGLNLTNALSADGTRVYWTDSGAGPGRIYLRENPLQPESEHLLGEAVGTGDLAGPVVASGNLTFKSKTAKEVKPVSGGEFVAGQLIEGDGIAPETTITGVEEPEAGVFTLTLDKAATAFRTGAALTGIASAVVRRAKADSGAFAVGQEVLVPEGGVTAGATIVAVEEEATPGLFELTLSEKASKGREGAALVSTSECTEAEKACTKGVSRGAERQAGTTKSQFWAAAADGSAAVFSTGPAIDQSLYRYELEGDKTTLLATGVIIGVMGASEDATRVYFASEDVLSGASSEGRKPVEGEPNLYLASGGEVRFIARLANADVEEAPSPVARDPSSRGSRVSADGMHAIWMSADSPTGYDNVDAISGERDTEIFRYDVAAEELRCISCNPSGARPVGSETGSGRWVGAQIPTWENSLYASRVLSDDGSRAFFETTDALVARDTNGVNDVYQWEEPGSGGCDEEGATYSAAARGCVDLISSGQSAYTSRLLDASPSGDDVFFTTLASLYGADYGLVDVYDARVGGGYPAPESPPVECEGEACQAPAPPPGFPAPSSSLYQGPGNPAPAAAKKGRRCPPGKRKVRRKGKVRCVRHERNKGKKYRKHRKHRHRAKRRSVRP